MTVAEDIETPEAIAADILGDGVTGTYTTDGVARIRSYGEQCHRAGAEAMREAAAERMRVMPIEKSVATPYNLARAFTDVPTTNDDRAAAIRSLPLPSAAEAAIQHKCICTERRSRCPQNDDCPVWDDSHCAAFTPDQPAAKAASPAAGWPDATQEALRKIADSDWYWAGDNNRKRGRCGRIAAQALGLPADLEPGWPPAPSEEARAG